MKYFAVVLLLAGCGETIKPAPAALALPPPAKVIVVHVAAPPPTTIPASSAAPAAVLRESVVTVAEAQRYVAWPQSKISNINALVVLTAAVSRSVAAMKASKKHGRYDAKKVLAAQANIDALTAYLENKGD